jgi:hypothetical protein
MKSALSAIFAAVALSLATAAVQAAGTPGASSVAGMLAKKQDTAARAHLVSESRWEEIQQMDEVAAQRLAMHRAGQYDAVNKQLAHGKVGDGMRADDRALECESDLKPIR